MTSDEARAAGDRLPDGEVARARGPGVVEAWFGRPTDRYGHGVLGDAIEGGSLHTVDEAGRRDELILEDRHVFEDITPRLADLDGDGRLDAIAIRADREAGASVVAYGMRDGKLREIAASAPIGRRNRWLSIVGVAAFAGDGVPLVAIVKTPHIGGVLEFLALRDSRLEPVLPGLPGYSTHVIGSRILNLGAVGDLDGDGVPELVLPHQNLRRVSVLRLRGKVETLAEFDLPGPVERQIMLGEGGSIAVLLDGGQVFTYRYSR